MQVRNATDKPARQGVAWRSRCEKKGDKSMTLGGVKAVVMARPVVREPANRGGLLVGMSDRHTVQAPDFQ